MISNQVNQKKRLRRKPRKLELQLLIYQEPYSNKRPMKYKINIIKLTQMHRITLKLMKSCKVKLKKKEAMIQVFQKN